jgi:hypothetical protein
MTKKIGMVVVAAHREERLAKLAEARAKLEARAKERFEREMAEYRAKLAARDEKTAASGKKPGGRPPAPPLEVRNECRVDICYGLPTATFTSHATPAPPAHRNHVRSSSERYR